MKQADIRDLLESKYHQYCSDGFIETDPIQIPHLFDKKEDIEISGFLIAIIAWGQRKSIISNGLKLIDIMGNSPHDFILNHSKEERESLPRFVHRTFQPEDLKYFLFRLQKIYQTGRSLETELMHGKNNWERISQFKERFFDSKPLDRTTKHLPSPDRGSSAKRMNMYLRWMVRKDPYSVDFGIWKNHKAADLLLPLDVHTGNISRKLGLLKRKQNDRKAVDEVMAKLTRFDSEDPVKYDFSLFGLGAFNDL